MSNGPEFQVPYRPAADVKTLRDEFAMAALQGYLAADRWFDFGPPQNRAKEAYMQADAMMAERAKR